MADTQVEIIQQLTKSLEDMKKVRDAVGLPFGAESNDTPEVNRLVDNILPVADFTVNK